MPSILINFESYLHNFIYYIDIKYYWSPTPFFICEFYLNKVVFLEKGKYQSQYTKWATKAIKANLQPSASLSLACRNLPFQICLP